MNKLNIVLVEPEIPQNTGNISRTCACLNAKLHLIKPLGFELSESRVKRAGLDYWQYLDLQIYENIEEFFAKNEGAFYYLSTKGKKTYSDETYEGNVYLFFGKETKGLPEELLYDNYDKTFRIPMSEGMRSLNLSNAVAIVAYEVEKQWGFSSLDKTGHLTKY